MNALTRLAAFTAVFAFAFATGVPANARDNPKAYLDFIHAAAAVESIAMPTDAALYVGGRECKDSASLLADGAFLAASYLRAPRRFASYHGQAVNAVEFAARGEPGLSQFTFTDALLRWRASAYVTEDTASTGGPIDLEVPVVRIERLSAKPTLCRRGMNGLQLKRSDAIGNDPKYCHRDGSI